MWSPLLALAILLATAAPALAHGDHRSFSSALIDPLITHHAVLEDELKLNAFQFNGARTGNTVGLERSGSLELAYAFNDGWGIEAFVPIRGLNVGQTLGPLGLGDLEIDPIKYAFWQERDLIMTATVATTLPTGDVAQGLGEGRVLIAPHLLIDRAIGRWAWHTNVAVEQAVTGDPETEFELNMALAHSFAWGSHVFAPLLELNSGYALAGEEAGALALALTPGVKWEIGGWHTGVGVTIPVTTVRDAEWVALVQVGYHVNWSALGGPGR